ncbi:unnamed protein product [Spirodela intermedia]|uniref:Uncharacterized protein n=1 Tax=Spirodela intermedia TaxID=51605 RepID=A0A7I8KCD4_SPIIN|nr:unnamed protein product [Spirodela intermedia]
MVSEPGVRTLAAEEKLSGLSKSLSTHSTASHPAVTIQNHLITTHRLNGKNYIQWGRSKGDKSLSQYFGEVIRLNDDLHVLLPISSDMTVLQFLGGLPLEYDGILSQILSGVKLPSPVETYYWLR